MAITAKFTSDFADFDKGVKNAQTGLTDFEKAASSVARSIQSDLLAMFSVGAGIAFIADTVEAAGALKTLSAQTQISTGDLQVMAAAMSEFGVSQEELGRALGTLSKKIAGGDDSVAGALAQMGLSLEDVRDLKGADLFLAIENGLSTLKGSLRDTVAATLFGDKLGASMAGASEGIEGAMGKARELNTIMSQESIDALDAYSTAINAAKLNIQNMTANAIGPLAEGLNVVIDAIGRGVSKWEVFAGLLPKGLGAIGTGVEGLATAIDKVNLKTDEHGVKATASGRAAMAALTDEQKATEFLRILQENAGKDLTEAQLKNLEQLKAIGQLSADNAKAVAGITMPQYKKYLLLMQEIEAAAQADAAANALRVKEQEKLTELMVTRELDLHKKLQTELATTTAKRLAHVNEGILKELDAQIKLNQAMGLDATGAVKATESALGTFAAKLAELNIIKASGESITKRLALAEKELEHDLLAEALATDQVIEAKKGMGDASTDAAPKIDLATGSVISAGSAAQQTAGSFFQMSAGLYEAIRAAQQWDALAGADKGIFASGISGVGGSSASTRYMGAANTRPPVSITINGSVLGNKDEIARVVGDAVTSSYRSGGNRLPV